MPILSIFLGILALGFLVFIHELGHYIVARRQKMRVEVFSIGFGKPIFSWMRDGVKWQVCVLPFGGYVKIAGMQKEKGVEPSDIPDGYFGKKPLARIKVALAGPVVNIVFSLIVFLGLYLLGGRDKPFSQFTHRIGWIDEKSELYAKGVRPGDEITEYGNHSYSGMKDILIAGAMKNDSLHIKGNKIDYFTKEKTPFEYDLVSYEDSSKMEGWKTIGIEAPASYLMYAPQDERSAFLSDSIKESGIEKNDHILWANGELVFSTTQLQEILNESTTYLTVKRGNKFLQTRVPRVSLQELKLSNQVKDELSDWNYEISSTASLSNLYFIPYDLSSDLKVTKKITFIDKDEEKMAFSPCKRCLSYFPLQKGDKIIAIDGQKVSTAANLLKNLQEKRALIIVQRGHEVLSDKPYNEADQEFNTSLSDLSTIVATIGTKKELTQKGQVKLLNPINLQKFSASKDPKIQSMLTQQRNQIAKIDDSAQRAEALKALEKYENTYRLGITLSDKQVVYNPSPFILFTDVFSEIQRTFSGLLMGNLSPKHLAGPIGIMHVVQQSWQVGITEGLYWVGMISLNLGLLNLLPIPVLDGGHIVLSFIEMFTKKPLKAKTMEKLIIPFVVLLVGFFIYITFHDISRILPFFK
jgi:regulator of sigma E protease